VRVEVAVTDSQGRPVAGAQVGAMQGTPPKVLFYQARTEAQGTAELSGLDTAAPVKVTCLAPGYLRLEQSFDAAPGLVRCALERLAGIEGTVVDEEDEPVAAATVAVRRSDHSAHTGKDGAFVLDAMEPGNYEFTVAAPGFRAVTREVTLASQERRRLEPVRLTKAGALSGRVLDGETEEPVSGAVLTVQDPPGSGSARSDADGLFTLHAAADGPLALEVTAAGYPPSTVEVPAGREQSGEPLVVELSPGGRIQVTVWDEETEAPCLGCSVSVTGRGDHGRLLTTDAEGQALTQLLAPGPYRVSRERVQTFGSYMTVSSGDDARTANVESGRTAKVSFGERRTTMALAFFPPPPGGWVLLADAPSYHQRLEPREDGTFRVRKDPGEEVALALSSPNHLRVETVRVPADFAEPELRVTLPETLVRGTLVGEAGPLPGVRIELLAGPGRAPAGWVVTGADGSFAVPHLRPGTYQMMAGGKPLGTFELPPGTPLDLGPLS
jgi:Carboxypeptidase regulatory-like domain